MIHGTKHSGKYSLALQYKAAVAIKYCLSQWALISSIRCKEDPCFSPKHPHVLQKGFHYQINLDLSILLKLNTGMDKVKDSKQNSRAGVNFRFLCSIKINIISLSNLSLIPPSRAPCNETQVLCRNLPKARLKQFRSSSPPEQ